MKKNNVFGIIILIAMILALGYLLGSVLSWIIGLPVFSFNVIHFLIMYTFMLVFPRIVNLIVYPIAKSTMNKNLQKQNFRRITTFISRTRYSFKSILCIDEDTGRVGYVSLSDPFRFQMANPGELSKIRSTVSPFARGGTRFVFFEFYYGENRMCFPTYRVRHFYVVSMDRVNEALAEGNRICDLLLRFNPGGDDFSINYDIPFSKTALSGFILSFISIYVTVAALLCYSRIAMSNADSTQFAEFLPAYVLAFIAAALAIAGLIIGVKVLKDASASPVRGKGFAKTSVIMSPIVLIIIILLLYGLSY